MKRRTFVKTTAATMGGLGLGLAACAGDRSDAAPETASDAAGEGDMAGRTLDRIGVQLYTVRTLLADDFTGVLGQVADIGYDEVEFDSYFGHTPEEVRSLLGDLGLAAPSAHVPIDRFRKEPDAVIAAAQTIGHEYLVIAWLSEQERQSLDQYRQHAALFNDVGRRCKDAGIQFAYHNHDFEFVALDGRLPYDLLLAETDPELVQMELDLFWIRKAGHDALRYFAAHPGRFPLCHVKDMTTGGEMAPVGEGTIDFAGIFGHTEEAGLRHYFVEHDNPEDPLASLRTSYQHLDHLHF